MFFSNSSDDSPGSPIYHELKIQIEWSQICFMGHYLTLDTFALTHIVLVKIH